MDLELLRRYKIQNPVKYAKKFGNIPLEEIVIKETVSEPVGPIEVTIAEKKDIELEFKAPVEPEELELKIAPEVMGDRKASKKMVRKPRKAKK